MLSHSAVGVKTGQVCGLKHGNKVTVFEVSSAGAWTNIGKSTLQSMPTIYRTSQSPNLYGEGSIDKLSIIVLHVEESCLEPSYPYISSGPEDAPRTSVELTTSDCYVWDDLLMIPTSQSVSVHVPEEHSNLDAVFVSASATAVKYLEHPEAIVVAVPIVRLSVKIIGEILF